MNEYQKEVDRLYNIKLEKYKLNPDALTDELHNELYGEAIREAQAQGLCHE